MLAPPVRLLPVALEAVRLGEVGALPVSGRSSSIALATPRAPRRARASSGSWPGTCAKVPGSLPAATIAKAKASNVAELVAVRRAAERASAGAPARSSAAGSQPESYPYTSAAVSASTAQTLGAVSQAPNQPDDCVAPACSCTKNGVVICSTRRPQACDPGPERHGPSGFSTLTRLPPTRSLSFAHSSSPGQPGSPGLTRANASLPAPRPASGPSAAAAPTASVVRSSVRRRSRPQSGL